MTVLGKCFSERTTTLLAVLTESELDDLYVQIPNTPKCQWENFHPYLRNHSRIVNLLGNQHIISLKQIVFRLEEKLDNTRILLQRKCVGFLFERIIRFNHVLEKTSVLEEEVQRHYGSIIKGFSTEIEIFSDMRLPLDVKECLLLANCQFDSIKRIFELRLKSDQVTQLFKPLNLRAPLNAPFPETISSSFAFFLPCSTVISRKKSEQTLIVNALLIHSELSDMERRARSKCRCVWEECFLRINEISLNMNALARYPILALQRRMLRVRDCFNRTQALVVSKCVHSLSIRIFRLYDNLRETPPRNLVAKKDKIMRVFNGLTAEIVTLSDGTLTWDAKISLANAKSILVLVRSSFETRMQFKEIPPFDPAKI